MPSAHGPRQPVDSPGPARRRREPVRHDHGWIERGPKVRRTQSAEQELRARRAHCSHVEGLRCSRRPGRRNDLLRDRSVSAVCDCRKRHSCEGEIANRDPPRARRRTLETRQEHIRGRGYVKGAPGQDGAGRARRGDDAATSGRHRNRTGRGRRHRPRAVPTERDGGQRVVRAFGIPSVRSPLTHHGPMHVRRNQELQIRDVDPAGRPTYLDVLARGAGRGHGSDLTGRQLPARVEYRTRGQHRSGKCHTEKRDRCGSEPYRKSQLFATAVLHGAMVAQSSGVRKRLPGGYLPEGTQPSGPSALSAGSTSCRSSLT
jgi:hypothetical protein